MVSLFTLHNLHFRFGSVEILRGINLQLQPGQMVAIVGPNGAGKSTLMSILSGYHGSYVGSCSFLGIELRKWNKRVLGRHMAFIPQLVRLEFPFTAEQVVLMGRTPHCQGLFESVQDREAVHRAMEITDTAEFAHREFSCLSGGERQRVILASALAQEPEALLLDEPTTFLDLKHQLNTYALLRDLAHSGMGVMAVTHDLNLAVQHADRLIIVAKGLIVADGRPDDVLTTSMLADVFGVDAEVSKGSAGKPWVFYKPGNPDLPSNAESTSTEAIQ